MQGAIRRWYDTVTAQLASLTSSLAGYLPLSGGSLSGGLSASSYFLSGVGFAGRDPVTNYHAIYDGDGEPALHLGGAAAGYQSLYRAEIHRLQSNTGAITFATFNSGGLTLTGSMTATNNITAAGNIVGNILTGQQVNSNGHIAAAGDINCSGQIDCAGNIDAGSYTLNGGPMVLLTEAQLARIEERLARLERATA